MKKLRTTIYICIITGLTLGSFVVVLAAFNPQINYQGKLTDTNDVAVPDNDYNMEFKLWATSTATSSEYLKWTETCTSSDDKITVTNGLFSHLLGSVHSFSADDVDFNQTLWLEVSIAGTTTDPTSSDWETLSPRKKLGAVPAAFVAEKIGDYGTSSIAILSEDETITGAWTFNNILSAAASSSSAILTVNQTGSGNLVDFQVATTSKFVINNSGEITTGEWKATAIATQWGGTGQDWSSAATGSIPFATSTGTFALLAPGTSDYYLKTQGAGQPPVWAEVSATNYYGPTVIVAASDSTSTSRAHYVCDGTDDQVQINNAINALPAGIGGTVLLLEGNYSIGSSTNNVGINITTSSVALIGSGKGTVLQRAWDASSDDGVITVGDGSATTTGVVIANLSIDGQKGTYQGSQNFGIYFNKKITQSRIQNTWIHDCDGEGIYLNGSYGGDNTNTHNLIEGNDVRSNDKSGILFWYSDYNIVSNNNFQSNSEYGIIIYEGSDNNTISSNNTQGNSYEGIGLDNSCDRNTITGNNVLENYQGILINESSNNNTITGNVVYNNDTNEIALNNNSDNNIVSSNSIYDTSGDCIKVGTSTCDNTYIIGNEISGGCTEVNDLGTGTTIQQRDWFEVEASSTIAALTVQQDGSGNIVEFKDGGTAVFTIANGGNVTVAGDFLPATTTQYDLGSSTYKWANLYAATTTIGGTIIIGTDTITATSTLTISTGASTDLILTPGTGGSVGIGTTTPTGIFSVATSTGASVFYIGDDGNVGIGTTTPDYALDVAGPIRFRGWQDLSSPFTDNVEALTVWNGRLCAGSKDEHVRCYDGSSWEDLGNVGQQVYALTVWNGKLCEGDNDWRVKCYTTSGWEDLGDLGGIVDNLVVWNGKLCANTHTGYVKCYDGSSWEHIGTFADNIDALTVWNGKLCEGDRTDHVRCYDGSTWEDLGDIGGNPYSLTVWNGKLCEGDTYGDVECYATSSWEDLGDLGGYVGALTVWNGKLCEGSTDDHVRCYHASTTWEDLGDVGEDVKALTVWNGKLCQGNDDYRVQCYFDSEALDNYWYKNGDILRWNRIVEAGDLYVEGNIGIGTKAPSSKLTITETGDFAFGDFNAQLVATMEVVTDWTSSDGVNTTTSLETGTSTVKVGSGALKITTTVGNSNDDTISKTIYSEDWSSYERLGFWIRADYTTTSTDATTSQIISIQFYCTSTPATTTHNITIQEMTKWQYQEWNISSATSTNIEWIRFRIDNDYGSPTFYIDHLRLYDDDERTAEMFVDKDGNAVLMGRGGVEIIVPTAGSGHEPSIKINSATVELHQPLSVDVPGDVGFDYDLTFMNTGLSQITSEGPLKISAGDSNHAENLTLTTSGSGDIIVSLTQTGQTFRITHALAASTTIPFIIDSETTATSTPSGGLFRVISDFSSDENAVFVIQSDGSVGVGDESPERKLDVYDTSNPQLRLTQADASQYAEFKVDASGDLRVTASGDDIKMVDDNLWLCSGGTMDSLSCPSLSLSTNGNLVVENDVYVDDSGTTHGEYKKICPTGWVWIPGNSKFGTEPGFCAMKYEAKCDWDGNGTGDGTASGRYESSSGDCAAADTCEDTDYGTWHNDNTPCDSTGTSTAQVVSTAQGAPIAYISQRTAQDYCQALGEGYHLITDQEWMTIAEDVLWQSENWCGLYGTDCGHTPGTASYYLAAGHNDDAPSEAQDATTTDSHACYATVDEDTDVTCTTTGSVTQKRTHTLSTDETIWDIAGNVWEWTDFYIYSTTSTEPTEMPTPADSNWHEYTAVTNYKGIGYIRPPRPDWSSTQRIGKIWLDSDTASGPSLTNYHAFFRGGGWLHTSDAGAFTLGLDLSPLCTSDDIGFRCSR